MDEKEENMVEIVKALRDCLREYKSCMQQTAERIDDLSEAVAQNQRSLHVISHKMEVLDDVVQFAKDGAAGYRFLSKGRKLVLWVGGAVVGVLMLLHLHVETFMKFINHLLEK